MKIEAPVEGAVMGDLARLSPQKKHTIRRLGGAIDAFGALTIRVLFAGHPSRGKVGKVVSTGGHRNRAGS